MKKNYLTSSPSQTQKIGESLAKEILRDGPRKKAYVIGLVGDLGGGKTTFLQGFAKGLRIKDKILSPTFIIMRRFKNFYHVDCYRIQKPEEILDLGLKEIISNPKNIVAIEWADRLQAILPKNTLMLEFEFIDEKTRRIVVR